MRKMVSRGSQISEIIYAESLNLYVETISSQFKKAPAVLFVTTQPFYEKYYERLVTLLDEKQLFEWYICPNNETISYINKLNDVLCFLEKTNLPTGTLILGAGNHHIYRLCAFLKVNSFYLNRFIYFSTTVTGFLEAVQGKAYLTCNQPFCIGAKTKVLPNLIVYDRMLHDLENKKRQSQDTQALIQLGAMFNSELFNLLTQINPTKQNLNLTPYLEKVIESQRNNTLDTYVYVMAFAKSFYHLRESHYLSRNQKEQIAFLLYFFWSTEKSETYFDFKSFVVWYEKMSQLNLELPVQMNTYDLAESLLNELNRFPKLIGIESIGQLSEMAIPSLKALYHTIERYRKIKEE